MTIFKPYWMVHGSQGPPTYKHVSLQSARQEAERMAKLYPGELFVILESIAAVEKFDVLWMEPGDDGCDIPF